MFKVGDNAVYPTQGIGVIEAIESKDFGGVTADFYILRIVDSDMTIMIPTTNADQIGMRSPIDKKRVSSIFSVLAQGPEIPSRHARQEKRFPHIRPSPS